MNSVIITYKGKLWVRKKVHLFIQLSQSHSASQNKHQSKEIKLVNPIGNQPWMFTGNTAADSESKNLATWYKQPTHYKYSDAGKDWGQKDKDSESMRRLNGVISAMDMSLSILQQTVRHGSLPWCNPCGPKDLDTTEQRQQFIYFPSLFCFYRGKMIEFK